MRVGRRSFLAGIGIAGAATVTGGPRAAAAATEAPGRIPPSVLTRLAAAETAQVQTAQTLTVGDPYHVANPGSDFMVGCLKQLGYEYVAAIPGSTFRGFQESVSNFPGGGGPEWLTTVHEEISGAMSHGYAKASGKPMACAVHGVVGVQHASMAVYNAYADRAPLLLLTANYADAAHRAGSAEWDHNATDGLAMLRGYVKYDEQPGSLQHFADALARAHALAMTPPMGPVALVLDQDLQEQANHEQPVVRPFQPVRPPAADPNAIDEIARMLVAAQNPVIVVDRTARTPDGVGMIVQLAELLQAPVVDQLGRMNFPTNHYLWSELPVVGSADVLLALDVGDLFDVVGSVPDKPIRQGRMRIKNGTKVIQIDSELLEPQANYQTKQRFYQADLPVAGDSQASLPSLIEAVQRAMPDARRNANAEREQRLRAAFAARRSRDADAAAVGWNASPISIPRLVMEVWNQIKGLDWALVSQTGFQSGWQQRLWDFTKYSQYIGGSGAAGVGYTSSAAVGAALAHRNDGVVCVNFNGDGDLLMSPGSMWSAAHHKLPLLTIVHNNRAWHEELMFLEDMAARRQRDPDKGKTGTTITAPNIDYAKIADGFGVYGQGPISDPNDLASALQKALAVVRRGEPALIDVVAQGR